MKLYKVGGSIRDKIMGRDVHDNDWVVVGSSVDQMIRLGFEQVGKDFPVFLHPITKEEYALARKEISTGNGYKDFTFLTDSTITLEDDLVRRDFTMNAMAWSPTEKKIFDPFNGHEDIKYKRIQHVNATHFVEDPVRLLRGARFASQLDFTISASTMLLFKRMVNEGMMQHLTVERVWKETYKALCTSNANKYFEILQECGALEILFPELHRLVNTPEQVKYHASGNTFKHTMIALTRVPNDTPMVGYAVLCHDLGKGLTPDHILPKHSGHDERGLIPIEDMSCRLKVPSQFKLFARLFCKNHMRIGKINDMTVKKQFDMVNDLSYNYKSEEQIFNILECFKCDWYGEEVQSEYSTDEQYNQIKDTILKIFNIMKDFKQTDLSEAHQDVLTRFKGAEFGVQYRAFKIDYLRKQLNKGAV